MLDNTDGTDTCRGIEVVLGRYITGEGASKINKNSIHEFFEITVIKRETLDLEL